MSEKNLPATRSLISWRQQKHMPARADPLTRFKVVARGFGYTSSHPAIGHIPECAQASILWQDQPLAEGAIAPTRFVFWSAGVANLSAGVFMRGADPRVAT